MTDHLRLSTASSSASTTYFASCRLRQSGGCRRSTLPSTPPFPKSSPLSRVSSINWLASSFAGYFVSLSFTSSTPSISPFPRTSPMMRCFFDNFPSSASRQFPTTSAFSSNFSRRMVLSTSRPTRHWMWPPPKVLKKTCLILSVISLRVTTAPMGKPFPIPLAMVTMSGLMPCQRWPQNFVPTRPKPVCTSSQIIRPPCLFRTRSIICGRYPSGRGLMPPTPWMHSKIKPETLPAVLELRASFASATSQAVVRLLPRQVLGQASFSNSNPPRMGEFQVPTDVMLAALPTNPWQPLRRDRNLYSFVNSRARLTAKSLASPPELHRQTLSYPSPSSSQSRLEYSACHSERQMGEVCVNLAT